MVHQAPGRKAASCGENRSHVWCFSFACRSRIILRVPLFKRSHYTIPADTRQNRGEKGTLSAASEAPMLFSLSRSETAELPCRAA
jgi:hypothetical protein